MATPNNQQIQDPSTQGTGGLRGLKGVNKQESPQEDIIPIIQRLATDYRGTMKQINATASPSENIGFVGINDSYWDRDITSASQLDNLANTRGELQPGVIQVLNGLAKGAITAGTTFLDGTLGLMYGAGTAIAHSIDPDKKADWSDLWDNDFSRAMKQITDLSEEYLPNYYTDAEINDPWYEHVFSANWIGDKFIKNIGFTIGAFYSGNVASVALNATKLPRLIGVISHSLRAPRIVSSSVGAALSALNEGRIEALTNATQWADAENKAALARYKQRVAELEASDLNPDIKDALLKQVGEDYNNALAKIAEDRLKMGNVDLALNIPILTAGNLAQFIKLYGFGYGSARRTSHIIGNLGELTTDRGKTGALIRLAKNPLAEGTEEISQRAASTISGLGYTEDVNNFYKSRMDPNAEKKSIDWVKAAAQGINQTVNDASAWEEFFIGALTGGMGMPRFRSIRGKDGRVQSPIVLEEGIYGGIKDYVHERRREEDLANRLNQRVQSPEFVNYYQGLIRHNKYQNDMDQAVENNDEFSFKNAEHAQLLSDITMFDNAGRLDDLKDLVESAYDISDENLQAIINNTTATTTDASGKEVKIGPFVDKNGTPMEKEEMIKKLTKNKDEMLNAIDNYQKIREDLDIRTDQRLTDEQLEELTWIKSQLNNWKGRSDTMTSEVSTIFRDLSNRFSQLSAAFAGTAKDENADASVRERSAKAAKNYETAYKTLDIFARFNGDVLATSLAREDLNLRDIFKEMTEDPLSGMSADEASTFLKKVDDITKITKARESFGTKLKEYLENPGKIDEAHETAREETARETTEKNNADFKSKVTAARNFQEFRDIMQNESDSAVKAEVLAELTNEGNEFAKNYTDTNNYDIAVQIAITNLRESPEATEAARALFESQVANSSNLEEIANPNSVFIDDAHSIYDDTLTPEENAKRFQEAQYVLRKAMEQVNNDNKFKDRFSEEYKRPTTKGKPSSKAPKKAATGSEGTPTTPPTSTGGTPTTRAETPVGNVTPTQVSDENKGSSDRVETPQSLEQGQKGTRTYYRPAIPELHLQASKEGDFRPFNVVAAEREKGANFDDIYNYLKDTGAFEYVNQGKLKPGAKIGFMIDPKFEERVKDKEWHKSPVIFMIDSSTGQVVGSLDSSQYSVDKFEGLSSLEERIIGEYHKRGTHPRLKPAKYDLYGYSREYLKKNDLTWESTIKNAAIRNKGGVDYIAGNFYLNARTGFQLAIEAGILSDSYSKDLGNMMTLNNFNKITGELKSLGINSVADVVLYIDKNTEKFDIQHPTPIDNLHITVTNNGYQNITPLPSERSWQYSTTDMRSSHSTATGPVWGIYGGHHYYYIPSLGGRGGDNITYWFKNAPSDKLKESFATLAELFNGVYDYNQINEILNQMIGAVNVDVNSKDSGDKKFISSETTNVSKIMTGKIPYSNQERSLDEIPNVSGEGKAPIFGIIKNGVLSTNGKIDDSLIVKPVDMANKEGRMYLLIPNAAGKYSPAAVRVKHFNNEEFSLDNTVVANTPMGKDIAAAIMKLANATSQDDVSLAMRDLAQDLYMQDIMITWFTSKAGDGIVISKKVRKPDGTYEKVTIDGKEQIREDKYDVYFSTSKKSVEVGGVHWNDSALEQMGETSMLGVPKDPNDIYKEILGHLTKFNLPLQVGAGKINQGAYNNRLISSDVLTSNISDARVVGSWFTTDYFDAEGNLHKAVNPASVTPKASEKAKTPVGGTEGATVGTSVSVGGTSYGVDLSTGAIYDSNNQRIYPENAQLITDLAWADSNFGKATNGSLLWNNKVLLPSGKVLDRSTQKYLEGKEAQEVKDKLAGRKKTSTNSKKVIAQISENQKRVDKDRTDGEHYYILEEDGQYHPYDRVHSRLGSNWVESKKQADALKDVQVKLSQQADNATQYNNYLNYLSNHWGVDLSAFSGKTDANSRNTIVSIIRDKMSGTNSRRALDAGTAVDSVIRNFFTSNETPTRPSNMSEKAFTELINSLTEIRSNIEARGERFLTNNIVLFQKYADGTRVAGEVDILSVDADGNFRIYDVKTSKYSFYDFTDKYGHKVNYFTNPSATQRMSTKDYYTLQLSAYKNLFESQYGTPVVSLGVLPFVLNYSGNQVDGVTREKGIRITHNPAVNVPLVGAVRADTSSTTNSATPIFNSALEIQDPINDVLPEYSLEDGKVGYFVRDGKLHRGYLSPVGKVNGVDVYMTKIPNITKGLGRPGEAAHVASNSYMAVFPNGNSITLISNDPNTLTEQAAKDTIKKILSGNPQRVVNMANEKTIMSEEAVTPKVETPKVETPSTVLSKPTESGAAKLAQAEQAIDEHDDEFEDDVDLDRLRKADDIEEGIWDREKEFAWLNKVLPQLSEQNRVRVIKGLIKVANKGTLAWGRFNDGVITLSDIAAPGTSYHEAFHVVFNLLLDINERAALFKEAEKLYGEMDALSLEEAMAEGFREYVMNRQGSNLFGKIKNFFQDLWIKVTNWRRMQPHLNAYYQMINKGEYSNRELPIETSSQAKARQVEYFKEMQDILANAKRDSEGNLLAPNGKKSNLTERQYAQVRTKAFKEWFGDWENNPSEASKVVDKNGEPLVVYHGGPKGITTFYNPNEIDKKYQGTHSTVFNKKNRRGIYFINKKEVAKEYSDAYGRDGEVYEVFLNIRNPKSIKQVQFYGLQFLKDIAKLWNKNFINYQNIREEDVRKLDSEGIDALYTGSWSHSTEYVVFNSNQIKSATENMGTFSTTNNDIRHREVNPKSEKEISSIKSIENPYSADITLGKPEADFDSVDADGFGTLIPILYRNTEIGEIALNNTFKNSDFVISGDYISMPEVGNPVEIKEEYRNKGYGKAAYIELAKLALARNKTLRSATDSARTPASTRVWNSLVRDGYARRNGDRYEIINSTLATFNNNARYREITSESKVVRLWHTSNELIRKFNKEMPEGYFAKHGGSPRAIFFADRAPESQSFLSDRKYKSQYDVEIKNPYIVNKPTPGKYDQSAKHNTMAEAVQYAVDNGYDSVIFKNIYDNMMYGDIYVVFDPEQIAYVEGQDNLGVDYGPNKLRDIPEDLRKPLVKRGWTEEQWNKISQQEREQALRCIVL